MARSRLELHALLAEVSGLGKAVYFQPPANLQMVYPCIVYQRESSSVKHADDIKYSTMKRYQVTVIDPDPDSVIPDKLEALDYTAINRFFVSDNLNHFVFTTYF